MGFVQFCVRFPIFSVCAVYTGGCQGVSGDGLTKIGLDFLGKIVDKHGMTITESDLETILNDVTKVIRGDIRWLKDEDHSPSVEFFVPVDSESGFPLRIRGSYNVKLQTLGFSMLLVGNGRIYGLDIGTDHRNPKDKKTIGKLHKHRWTHAYKDKHAYVPSDITAGANDVVKAWKEFCAEAKITHEGTLSEPCPMPLFGGNQ